MITGIGSVAILVRDAKKSAKWYQDKLGFEVVGIEGHAVFVKPKDSQMLLHLCEQCTDWGNDKPGGRTGVWFQCGEVTISKDASTGRVIPASDPANVERSHLELKQKGVEFSEELTKTKWGKMTILKDPDGNEFEIS